MAISKIIYKESANATPVTWMDTTQKTVTAGTMLNGVTALKNDGTDVTGNIASKSSSDLTANNLTVTAPAGYYASAATKTLSDQNLVAGNVKKDVTIFGTTGSYEGSGGGNYQQKTVTPTTSQQVITADQGGTKTFLDNSENPGAVAMKSGSNVFWILSASSASPAPSPWEYAPVDGETYHLSFDYYRSGYSRHYTYSGDILWTNGAASFVAAAGTRTLSMVISYAPLDSWTVSNTSYYGYIRLMYSTGDDDTLSSDTVSVSVTQDVTGYDALSQVTVLAIPGDGTYAKTVIVPQQTVSGSMPTLTHTAGLVDGEFYIITLDGAEYLCTAESQWSGAAVVMGNMNWYYGTMSEYDYPFAVGYEPGSGLMDCVIAGSGSHTIKVEKIDLS